MEIAEVSVTTKASAMEKSGGRRSSSPSSSDETNQKRRKINNNNDDNEQEKVKFSSLVSSSSSSETKIDDERCVAPTFSDEHLSSCCSSNGSIGFYEDTIQFVDLEVDSSQVETWTCNCADDERDMSPSSNKLLRGPNSEEEEVMKPMEANNNSTSCKKKPTDEELEEFFSVAESEIQKSFSEKYNYDIVKDVPLLGGRYEWVQIKP